MIRGIGEWWGKWKSERRKMRDLPGEYEALAQEFGHITARCLAAEEALARERGTTAKLTTQIGRMRDQYALDVPGLTPGETERLAILSEECGEVVRAIGKIQRYGWESNSPFVVGGRSNRMALERELGSMRAVVNLMLDAQDLRLNAVQSWQRTKKTALEKWTLYQECSMPRDEQLGMMRAIRESQEGAAAARTS